ncbi:hypothetical protein EII19_03575 [Comamonadaceae bacterium OH2310_COT-174]|nr:hypothetical protein EII19_03575 [Comamonadaceae bacterium OH2310_COT-174]
MVTGLALAVYVLTVWRLSDLPRPKVNEGLRVRVPVLLQVLQAGGDRYLAADLAVIRNITVGTEVNDSETLRIQAVLAEDVALMNPRHEDNYYMAAALLPWQGYVQEGQAVLRRAAQTRVWDMWPAFFYAFNTSYFERDYAQAAQWAERAALRTGEPNASALRAMAAKWLERGDDPAQGIEMIERLKTITSDERSLRLMDARIERLRGLQALRQAASAYRQRHGMPPARLEQLLGEGLLTALPRDPLGMGYELDTQGMPQLAGAAHGAAGMKNGVEDKK